MKLTCRRFAFLAIYLIDEPDGTQSELARVVACDRESFSEAYEKASQEIEDANKAGEWGVTWKLGKLEVLAGLLEEVHD